MATQVDNPQDDEMEQLDSVGYCEHCEWSFWLPVNARSDRCPHCACGPLVLHERPNEMEPNDHPPESLIPFSLSGDALAQQIISFADRIPFAPPDLIPQTLAERLKRVYLPVWLVDADIQATWQAEMGFDYEVVSHQDRFTDYQGWMSQEVTESRIRWELRLGRLRRTYSNIPAPAMEEHETLVGQLGGFDLAGADPYQPEVLENASMRIPERTPQDAWPTAMEAIQEAAMQECCQAAGADHVRQFRWSPADQHQNWTLLLLPVFTTFYFDDGKTPQTVLVHGQTGRLAGARRASMRRAQRATTTILIIAAVLFLLSLLAGLAGVILPPLLLAGGLGLFIALIIALGGTIPLLVAWRFNRAQQSRGAQR